MADSDQLKVPPPGDSDEPEDRGGTLILAGTITLLAGLAFFLYQIDERSKGTGAPDVHTDAELDASSDPDASLRSLAEKLERAEGPGPADGHWSNRRRLAALRHGSARLRRAACTSIEGDWDEEGLGTELYHALLDLVRARSGRAPWTCLLLRFFGGRIGPGSELRSALEDVWTEMRQFKGRDSGLVARAFVQGAYRRGELPKSTPFRRWLRLCALHFDAYADSACREVFADEASSAKRRPRDLLELVERHLRVTELDPDYDLPIVVDALGQLATSGQPPDWRVSGQRGDESYDSRLQIGAIFYLCRFVQSPDREMARRAARRLTEAADFVVRAVDEKRHPRWIRACQIAFREGGPRSDPRAPALAVWTGEPDERPEYALRGAVERGDCPAPGDEPVWICGPRHWRGDAPSGLTDFYVATHQMEWRDSAIETEPTK